MKKKISSAMPNCVSRLMTMSRTPVATGPHWTTTGEVEPVVVVVELVEVVVVVLAVA
jgi:hypothetical protein